MDLLLGPVGVAQDDEMSGRGPEAEGLPAGFFVGRIQQCFIAGQIVLGRIKG